MFVLDLDFTQVDCEVCDEPRSLAGTCDSCRHVSEELDPEVERRREALERLELRPTVQPVELTLNGLAELWQGLSRLLGDAIGAISDLASSPDSDGHLAKVQEIVDRLAALRGAIETVNPLRPMVALWAAVGSTVEGLQLTVDNYLAAFAAQCPAEARQFGESAQAAIDDTARRADEASVVLERLGLVSDLSGSVAERVNSFTLNVFSEVGASDIVDLDMKGADVFRRITGNVQCPTGLGANLLVTATYAQSMLNEERYYACAQTAFRALRESRAFSGLIGNDDWWQSFREASLEMVDSAIELESAIRGASGRDRLEVRGAIRFAAQMIERIAPVLLSTILVAEIRRGWQSFVNKDAGSIVDLVRQAGLEALVLGIDRTLRNADAHGSFEIESEGVTFTASGREYDSLTRDELVDRVLACLESCIAIHAGIVSALAAEDVPIERIDEATSEAWPREDQMRAVLALNGIGHVSIVIAANTLTVRGRATRPLHKPLITAVHLHPYWPTKLERVHVTIEDPEMSIEIRGPAALVRNWDGAEGIEKETAFVELLAGWRMNAQRVASRPQIRHWTARRAAIALRESDQFASDVQALIQLAVDWGDKKLEKALRALLVDRRWSSELDRWFNLNIAGWNLDPHAPD